MASIFKRPGSPYWSAAFDVPQPDGTVRRLKKSTKKTKRAEALVEAIRIEAVARKAAEADTTGEALNKSFSILTEAAEAASRGELSEGRARALLARLTEASTGEPLKFYTVRSWIADWLAGKKVNSKGTTLARYETSTDAFLAWLSDKADGRLESVTKADVRGFRDAIRKGWRGTGQPRSARTTNAYTKDVASVLRSAVREGLLLASPASGIELLPEDDSTKRETFTMAEIGTLIATAGEREWQRSIFSARNAVEEIEQARGRDWQGVILVGFYAGPRLKDVARLRWSNVDFARGVIDFMPGKTDRKKKRLQVPLHPRLSAFLKSHDVPTDSTAFVFPSLGTVAVGGKVGLSSHFVAIMDTAGVDRMTARAGVKNASGKSIRRAAHARSFHSLRHSLTSSLANLDVPEEIRQRIVGHESREVHKAYTHHERETLARALDKLPHV